MPSTLPPKDMDVKRAVLSQAVTDVRRFAATWRGMLTIADEIEKLLSVSQAVEETEKRLADLRQQEVEEKRKLEAIREEVKLATAAHEMVIRSIERVRAESPYEDERRYGVGED